MHTLSFDVREKISKAIEEEFAFLFEQLRINNTKAYIEKYVKPITIEKNKEFFLQD